MTMIVAVLALAAILWSLLLMAGRMPQGARIR